MKHSNFAEKLHCGINFWEVVVEKVKQEKLKNTKTPKN